MGEQAPSTAGAPHGAGGAGGDAPKLVSFGKYLLLDRIATGGMAEVWLGKTVDEGGVSDLLAIKRLLSRFSDDEEFLHMFVDEARIAGQLDHPGIVQIGELGKVGSSLYIAMEFVWGRDLLGILRRLRELGRAIDPTTAAYVAARMCESLHFAHTAKGKDGKPLNVVHRDVSPQNVIVSFDGKVKLIDFGIAKAASRSTKTQAGTLKGKVGYMSPEQVRGASIDHRSDQFAVGTVLYEMITGRPLFSRVNNYEAMELVREADVPPLLSVVPECPPRLAEIVMKALSKHPEDRFANAHELQKALSLYLADADPGYERFTLVTWLRAIFKDDMAEEKARLDALDLIGRPAMEPVAKKRTNASTRLEIGAVDLFDDDDDAETQIFDGSPLSRLEIEMRPAGPYEVFFHRDEREPSQPAPPPRPLARSLEPSFRPRGHASESWRAPRTDMAEMGPYRRRDPVAGRDTDPSPASGTTAPATAPERRTEPSVMLADELRASPTPIIAPASTDVMPRDPTGSDAPAGDRPPRASAQSGAAAPGENVVLDPAEINSQVIRALLPTGKTDPAAQRAKAPAREASQPVRTESRRDASSRRRALEAGAPPRRRARRGDVIFLVIAAFFMLVVGAGATYWWLTSAASAAIEVRTTPPVDATVLIDGAPRGRAPMRIDGLAPGRHTIALVAEGYQMTTRDLVLAPSSSAILELPMTPIAAGVAPP